jgi:uncharacterized membrane protein YsdA (DUF1294 family)
MSLHVPYLMIGAICFVVLNAFTFALFWADKRDAQNRDWRVPESTLLLLALIGGSAGAIAGQQYWRHKTRKEPFRSILFGIACFHVVALGWWLTR